MRVLHVTYHGGTGGISVLILNLVKFFHGSKDTTIEVCYAAHEGAVAEEVKSLGTRTYCLNVRGGFDVIRASRLIKLIREGKYDLVHLHYFTPVLRLMTFFARPRVVIQTEHGGIKGEIAGPRWWIMRRIHRLMRSGADFYTAVSEDSRNDLVNYRFARPERTQVIYNGIAAAEFQRDDELRTATRAQLGVSDTQIVIGTIRSLTPKMGIDHFVSCASEVKRQIPNAVFVIVGDGPLRQQLQSQARRVGVEKEIMFLGERRDIRALLSAMDIFVMPSVWETFGIAALEAMAADLPVVAYAVGGLREVVDDQVTGILVRNRDPQELAKAIIALAHNPHRRKSMGQRGKKRAEAVFSLETTAIAYRDLYEWVLGRRSTALEISGGTPGAI